MTGVQQANRFAGEVETEHTGIGLDDVLTISILLFASLDMAGWVERLSLAAFLIRATWWLLYGLVVLRLVRRFGTEWIVWLVRRQTALGLLLAIALLSPLWSLAPPESLHTAGSLIATTLLGVYIGYTLAPGAIAKNLSIVFAVVIVGGLAALPVLPASIVIEPTTHQWRGLVGHKNSFGAMAAVALLLYVAPIVRRRAGSPWRLAMSAACLLALLLSRSVTSLVACGVGLASFGWPAVGHWLRRARWSARLLLWLALGLAVAAVASAIAPIARTLGRDATFNGRTQLWAASWQIIRERPLTGYGYHVVWRKQAGTLLPGIQATAERSSTSAHNDLLNVATELGVPAAALLAAYFIGVVMDAVRFQRRQRSSQSLFVTAFLLTVATLGLAEQYLVAAHSVFWILCVAMAVTLRRAVDPSRPAALASSI